MASLLDPIGAVGAVVSAAVGAAVVVVMTLHCLQAQGFNRRSDGPVDGLTGPVCVRGLGRRGGVSVCMCECVWGG